MSRDADAEAYGGTTPALVVRAGEHADAGSVRPGRSGLAAAGRVCGSAFVVVALTTTLLARTSPLAREVSITFVAIVLEALPFMLLGALISGLIEVFVSRDRIVRLLPRRRTTAIFAAAGLGTIFPVCECAVIPIARRLVHKGLPFSVAVGYLLGGPIVNILVAGSTYVAYAGDWRMVVGRLVCGYTVAVFVALIMDELFPADRALLTAAAPEPCCGHANSHENTAHARAPAAGQPSRFARLMRAGDHAADEFLLISQFLVVGAFVAAVSQCLVPRAAFAALAEHPPAAIGGMMTLAVGLNVCSEADAFVAASYRPLLPLAAQLAFLVLGPMLDLKLLAMYLSFIRRRAIVTMALLMVGLVFVMTLALHYAGWGSAS